MVDRHQGLPITCALPDSTYDTMDGAVVQGGLNEEARRKEERDWLIVESLFGAEPPYPKGMG